MMVYPGQLGPAADYLADTYGAAAWCVTLFASARCAGADVKALVPAAQAALILGAIKPELTRDSPPFGDESQYLDYARDIRNRLIRQGQRLRRLTEIAAEQAETGDAWIREAISKSPVDMGLYNAGVWLVSDARYATEVAEAGMDRIRLACRRLVVVPVVFGLTYEGTVDFVARGGLLPYRGRWITGGAGRPTVRWIGKGEPKLPATKGA